MEPDVTVTSPLTGRTVIRAPFLADMRARLDRCGAESRYEQDHAVWSMPRRTLSAVVEALRGLFPSVRVLVELTPGRWVTLDHDDLLPAALA